MWRKQCSAVLSWSNIVKRWYSQAENADVIFFCLELCIDVQNNGRTNYDAAENPAEEREVGAGGAPWLSRPHPLREIHGSFRAHAGNPPGAC